MVVLNSKTEFVTVGEGESKHPIPLEYITKEKEEDKKTKKEFFANLEKQHKEMQKEAAEKEKAKLLDKDRLKKYKEIYEKNKKYIKEHDLSDVDREVAKQKQEKLLTEIEKMEKAQSEKLKQMKLFNSKIEEVIAEAFCEAIAENCLGE